MTLPDKRNGARVTSSKPRSNAQSLTKTQHNDGSGSDRQSVAAALALAAIGWPVFPCRPGEKIPATRNGFKDATTDADTIRSWWTRNPEFNLAIATGAPGPDVLDVDNKSHGNGFGALERVKRAGLLGGALATVNTPSSGVHIYFQGTEQGNQANIGGQPLDFRGRGGYVLAPPSMVNGKPYSLVDWRSSVDGADVSTVDMAAVTELLTPRRSALAMRPSGSSTDASALPGWVAALPEGNRNAGLYWAACRLREIRAGDAEFALIAEAAMSAGLDEREVWATINSARRIGGAR